jgi:hypothetical protein
VVDALERAIPEGTQNAERKIKALVLARELLRGTKYEEDENAPAQADSTVPSVH